MSWSDASTSTERQRQLYESESVFASQTPPLRLRVFFLVRYRSLGPFCIQDFFEVMSRRAVSTTRRRASATGSGVVHLLVCDVCAENTGKQAQLALAL